MRPVLFHIDGLVFHSYTTMLALAFLVGTVVTVRTAERQDPPLPLSPHVGIWALLGALLGARVFYIVQYQSVLDLWRVVYLLGPGLVYYGGLFGGLTAVSLYLYVNKLPYRATLDVMAPQLALGQAITRVGCFLNGCCYGEPTHFPLSVRYAPGSIAYEHQLREHVIASDATASLPVHPTQLYMVAGLAITFLLLRWSLRRKQFSGATCAHYAILYGLLRFGVEFLRGDSARSVYGLTVSQTISLILLAGGLAVLVIGRIGLLRDREAD